MNNTQDGNPPVTPTRYSKDLHLQHVQAFWEGNLEWLNPFSDEWAQSIHPPDTTGNPSRFRIKQPKQLRPWNPEEIPLGAWIRVKGFPDTYLITGIENGFIIWTTGVVRSSTPTTFLRDYEHSTDQGKTWLPCGVLE